MLLLIGEGSDYILLAHYQVQKAKSRFMGGAWVAKDEANFQKALALPGAVLKELDEALGGGRMITFPRPNGTFFHVVFGQEERSVHTDAKELPSATHVS
jgi:hypothetical protein